MKYPIDLRKRIYSSVVPIECGDERGTAFFISSDTLLTARHVVVANVMSDQPVLIRASQPVLCDVVPIAPDGINVDIVLLKCKDYVQNDYLKLLSAEFNEERELSIVGFPKEFGNCSECIHIEVRDCLTTKKEDYDTTVVRTDTLSFTSYKGFSGSPVLNEKGSVIGVAVNQFSSSLGYISMKRLTAYLEAQGVALSKDWQSEDFSLCGRGRCQRQVEKAISYAALRYNKDLHVANTDLDEMIDLFAIRKKRNEIESNLTAIETIAMEEIFDFRGLFDKYQKGSFEDLYDILSKWKDSTKESIMTPKSLDFFQDTYVQLQSLLKQREQSDKQLMLLRGYAGMGKTHYVCATAERLCKYMNVYLLFGSRFVEHLDFESQLYDMMDLAGSDIMKLNEEMVLEDSNALIIIDALNEGATDTFWKSAVERMKAWTEKCDRIKLLVTYRNDEIKFENRDSEIVELTGFDDKVNEAVQKYFHFYQIDDKDGQILEKYQFEFKEPLFLSMFCLVAHRNSLFLNGDFSYSDLFHKYLKYRNEAVSKGVDEDPHRNVTEKALMKFASYSLYYNLCNDISREKARYYADQICRNRLWSNSLLNWLLKENLMLATGYEGETLMFGYQKMGDFLMADLFKQNKMSEDNKIAFVLEKGSKREGESYRRFIMALLSDWNLTPKLLNNPKSLKMSPLILDSLKHYGKNNHVIFEWMQKNQIFSVRILHDYMEVLSLDVFISAHQVLSNMDMASRDCRWSVLVNKEYSHRYDLFRLNAFMNSLPMKKSDEDAKKIIILLCWMCTTPHPFVRAKIMRWLVGLFDRLPEMVHFGLSEFHDCNDPYVVQMLVCAIYGHLLRNRNVEETVGVADKLLLYFYQDNKAPNDILIRQWTMQILALADEWSGRHDHFGKIHPPFVSPNPFDIIVDSESKIDSSYFGTSIGAKKMYDTLYGFSDFERYILGTNNRSESHVFMNKENGKVKGVSLDNIQLLIANVAKYVFKWNDELGKLDNSINSEGRYHNLIERFGKKYLWLALYHVDALLSDHCSVVDESHYVYSPTEADIEPIPYPWHTYEYSRIDPSVLDPIEAMPYKQFKVDAMEDVEKVTNEQWLDEEYPVQAPRLKVIDEDQSIWIVLTCYDGYKMNAEEDTCKDLFLFSNAAFIKNEELDVYKKWAKKKNFYGRWMPECRNGSIEYLWNEYPWSAIYKRTLKEHEDYNDVFEGNNFTLFLSYESQLQEDWIE